MNLLIDTRYLKNVPKIFGSTNWDRFIITKTSFEYLLEEQSYRGKSMLILSKYNKYINQLVDENLCIVIEEDDFYCFEKKVDFGLVYKSIINFIENNNDFITLFTDDINLINEYSNKKNIQVLNSKQILSIINISEERLNILSHNASIDDLDYIRLYLFIIFIFFIFILFAIGKSSSFNIDIISFFYGFIALLIAIILYNIKLWNKLIWGITEIIVGFLNSVYIYNIIISEDKITNMIIFQMTAGIYLIMRGIENIDVTKNIKLLDKILIIRALSIKKIIKTKEDV